MAMTNGFFFILCNKPGRLSFGTQEDFDSEEENGYNPFRISGEQAMRHAVDGDDFGDPDNGGKWSVHLYGGESESVPSWFSWCVRRQEIVDAMRPHVEEIKQIDEILGRIDLALKTVKGMRSLLS